MNLTLFTDYSLRTLIYLGSLEGQQKASVEQIAKAYGISHHHLVRVGQRLAKLGLIKTLRGRNGGIELAKEPADISIGWLVRELEDNMNLVDCFSGEQMCAIQGACGLQGMLAAALHAYLQVLDRYTLADVIRNRSAIAKLFADASEWPS
ncbi:Rrf2 family transcriptional regulator [Ferroacidibacillus organovorans]|uniref:HTH-type transcriptional regulator NsrR n=1 Tax=Ferroacidibacillus organovorans TaxID=1765683 RepID=A0A162U4N6_9BACL|nr:Rrf2 family transcriptional regulator [Ferroacidibacillus organovorans]KYP81397.1 hypothetical protein AYJ22_01130 [Ferroacidibacillus organovorans]OAG95184.1 hypothetical protein AYW79_01730 [Ferroacidibacillus organovorans]OPG15177.1 hypothetical protein B2M26_13585 [Ferroacidibacillus organovorans]